MTATMGGAMEQGELSESAIRSGRRLLRDVQRGVVHTVIDGVLPALTAWKDDHPSTHHHDIPYHEHEGVAMHLDVYRPDAPGPHPVLVSYHGGGWMYGIRENLQRAGRYFARRGYVVFNCSYRLAPRWQLPAGIQDAVCALRWVADHAAEYDGDPERIGVWGDSAGGHLSAMMAVGQCSPLAEPDCRCNPCNTVDVCAAVHYYGVFDFQRFARLHFPFVRSIMRGVAGERATDRTFLEAISPERLAGNGKVPPTLLLCGTLDPLLGETKRYARRLARVGADIDVEIYTRAVHGFVYLWWTREFEHSLERTVRHFDRYLKHVH